MISALVDRIRTIIEFLRFWIPRHFRRIKKGRPD